jgi:hypothetical protein
MLFKIIRAVQLETLSIRITFEQSEDFPCEAMTEHADAVEDAVRNEYEGTDKPADIIAFEIADRYRRVECVEVEDEAGDVICCECC